jgi:erythromycin esterase
MRLLTARCLLIFALTVVVAGCRSASSPPTLNPTSGVSLLSPTLGPIASPSVEAASTNVPTEPAIASPSTLTTSNASAVIDQLNREISPLATTDPDAPLTDLTPLDQIIGDAQIVGIGEATHGTHEFMTMHERMTRYLITERGFRIVALEAPAAVVVGIDQYVQGETNDASAVQASLGSFWFYGLANTDFWHWVTWLRAYNQHADPAAVVHVVGIDPQENRKLAPALISEYLTPVDPDLATSLAKMYQTAQAATGTDTGVNQSKAALAALLEAQPRLVAASSQRAFDQAVYLAQTIVQDQQLRGGTAGVAGGADGLRDQQMADNISWVLDHAHPAARIVVWAHNEHVMTSEPPTNPTALAMGGFLRQRYGERYRAIAQTFARGNYVAYPAGTTTPSPTTFTFPTYPSTMATALLAQLAAPRFLLNVRAVPAASAAGQWLRTPTTLPFVGAINAPMRLETVTITDSYDALCFIADTTAITPL